ncbi:MAG TPA: amidase family protein, partial [Caulobacteraceae bacterium]
MTETKGLTLKAAIDGLRAKTFSAEELATAHLDAIAQARPLNAFVLETPEQALAMARASDARIARGEAGALEGAPLGIKDLFCTRGFRSTAGSRILED